MVVGIIDIVTMLVNSAFDIGFLNPEMDSNRGVWSLLTNLQGLFHDK